MNVPASRRSDQVAVMPWIGWQLCTGLDGRNGVDLVAGFTGMRTEILNNLMKVKWGFCLMPLSHFCNLIIDLKPTSSLRIKVPGNSTTRWLKSSIVSATQI
jgi:hypothetical protein